MKSLLETYIIKFIKEEIHSKSSYRGFDVPRADNFKSERYYNELFLNYFNDAIEIGLNKTDAQKHAEKSVAEERIKDIENVRRQKSLYEPKLESKELDEVVKKSGSKYVLMSHKGKKLGTHNSKEDAEKQEKAIQISKARAAGHHIPKK